MLLPRTLLIPLALALALTTALALRLLTLLHHTRRPPSPRRRHPVRVLIVLGSGGHTTEMFRLLRSLDTATYAHRTYVVSSGDAFSAVRAVEFERGLDATTTATSPAYDVVVIPRARAVHQSLLSTPASALRCFGAAVRPLLGCARAGGGALEADPPALVLTNGPGTAVVVVLAALVLRFFNVRGVETRGWCRTLYVESFARVTSLSLSGRLLVRVVDRFLVQWEGLKGAGGRAEWEGVLV